MQLGPLQTSGRVIAGGRLLLACLFLLAVWADSQSLRAHAAIFVLLAVYAIWSLGVTLLVWKDWWRDARLAAPAHVIDVAVFMVMLYSTEGYTSPYFTFFIFILLSAAIRWGWKETAITAGAIIAVYFTVGLLLGPSPEVDVERFIVRTGHLFILSAILIWFGANQWIARPRLRPLKGAADPVGAHAFVAALQAGMTAVGARRGVLLWRDAGDDNLRVISLPEDGERRSSAATGGPLPEVPGCLLFELRRDRVLMRADASRWRFLRASETLPAPFKDLVDDSAGLALPIAAGTAEGLVVFQDVRALSTDDLEFAPQLARDFAARLQEAALFAAVEERSMAKARVAVARDLHDSVVQFLAGLGFQLEALKRLPATEGALGQSLAELKDAVMTEQRHLRAFIRGLKTGGSISLRALSRDCASLCELLARHWGVDCTFTSKANAGSVPMRTQLDIHHLIREAVANAARHGSAMRVEVQLSGGQDHLGLTIVDDGRGFAAAECDDVAVPASLSARVQEAHGELEVVSKAGKTSVSIRLPPEAAA